MKLFIQSLNYHDISPELIAHLPYITQNKNIIISSSGIFKATSTSYIKLIPHDVPVISITIGKISCLLDQSRWVEDKHCFTVGTRHVLLQRIQLCYTISHDPQILFVIEKDTNDNICDIFFEFDEDAMSSNNCIKDEIEQVIYKQLVLLHAY
jgi:hypothetical protein